MVSFTPQEYADRVRRLQRLLGSRKIDLVVLNRSADLYYYSGSVQPLYLLVPAAGNPVALARKAADRIRQEAVDVHTEPFANTKDLTDILSRHGLSSVQRVGFALDVTSYATVIRFSRLLASPEIVDVSLDLRGLRMVKSAAELAILARAGEIMAGVPRVIREGFRPGMTELQVSAMIENYFRLQGHGTLIRVHREAGEVAGFGVCTAGVNGLAATKFDSVCVGRGLSAAVPYGSSNTVIEKGVPVLLDYAFVLDGYHVDMTRMFSWGLPQPHVLRAYEAMVRVEQATIEALRSGTPWEDVYNIALQQSQALGFADEFMGCGADTVKFVGHGIGLELDEPPFLAERMKDRLDAGMVVAVEPKVTIPGLGVIGIEDTLVVTEHGARTLTPCSPDFMVFE